MTERREIVVVGGGLAGTVAAIGFAAKGFDTLHVCSASSLDGRSTALLGRSVAFLEEIGVFEHVRASAEPLVVMRIVDDSRRLLRAPTVEFHAGEIGLAAFGYNILNADLHAGLEARGASLEGRLDRWDISATGISVAEDGAVVAVADGRSVRADLVVAADGRRSRLREASGIRLHEWSYPQSAVVLNFAHRLPHGAVSTEFHTRTGPFTQVPLPGRRSSLVWVEEPRVADLLVELPHERLSAMIEDRLHSILGAVTVEGAVQRFPLSGARAERMTGERLALVGEAGHAFPPIGAQGLNLGLRDIEELIAAAGEHRDDPGGRTPLARYEAARRTDVASRTAAVDLLNRSLLSGFLGTQAARAVGLTALGTLPFLRRFAMREGVVPGAGLRGLPPSMRERMDGHQP